MNEKIYHITLHTQLGPKCGVVRINKKSRRFTGELTLLKNTTKCHGILFENGHCQLCGQIKTLLRPLNYIALGRVEGDDIFLVMETRRGTFQVTGTVCRKEQ